MKSPARMAKSGRQRAVELHERRKVRKQKRAERLAADRYAVFDRSRPPAGSAPVNADLLAPTGSYDTPDFAQRGYYLDRRFSCRDCGKDEVWTATQQKWWYEVAKGDVWTIARRCRPCRRKERERVSEVRRVSAEGRARKAARLARKV